MSINKEGFKETPEISEVPMPFGWKVQKISDDEYKWTPTEDYLDLAIEAEKEGKRYIKASDDKFEIVYENKINESQEDSLSMHTAKKRYQGELKNFNSCSSESVSNYMSFSWRSIENNNLETPKRRKSKSLFSHKKKNKSKTLNLLV